MVDWLNSSLIDEIKTSSSRNQMNLTTAVVNLNQLGEVGILDIVLNWSDEFEIRERVKTEPRFANMMMIFADKRSVFAKSKGSPIMQGPQNLMANT